jgi:hypothetical protein
MKAVDMIVTELAVFAFENDVLTLIELMPGATLEEVRNKTAAKFIVRMYLAFRISVGVPKWEEPKEIRSFRNPKSQIRNE